MHKISFSVLTHLLATLFFLLLPISEAFAQSNGATTGSIVGTVNDIQSAALAGATVKAKQPNTNFERTVQADQEGNFSFLQLSPGDYELEVEV
ncbi:MAG: carboxypeptidase regulatory-like domain-containing protein, partial [Blastocatellia bacterium]|nr:carboxypeptidase regulatory-like domain-containing protein [Blastocatellia bacterium]